MNDTNVKVYTNPLFGELRTAGTAGNPLFCLSDVCKALNLQTGATKNRLEIRGISSINTSKEVKSHGVDTGKFKEEAMTFIDEPNLYRCIFQSRKKEAKQFQDWVFNEVLPAIRKTGGYIATNESMSDEEIMAKALSIAQATIERKSKMIEQQQQTISQQENVIEQKNVQIELQEKEIEKAAPKVKYYDEVLQSDSTMTTRQIANVLGMDAHALNQKLASIKVIFKQSGMWMLYAPYNSWKLHSVRTQTYTRTNGEQGTNRYTVWTERGARFIHALFNNDWSVRRALHELKTTV